MGGVGLEDKDGMDGADGNDQKVKKKQLGDFDFENGETVFDLVKDPDKNGGGDDYIVKTDGNIGVFNGIEGKFGIKGNKKNKDGQNWFD